jgi:hypothetical protein
MSTPYGNLEDITFSPRIVHTMTAGPIQTCVEVVATLIMSNDEFDKLTKALRSPKGFKVVFYEGSLEKEAIQ